MEAEPLILTAKLDDASQGRLDRERREHFPPGRNVIPAHLTLFHHLPGELLDEVSRSVEAVCQDRGPSQASVSGLRFLGRGVAYELEAPELLAARKALINEWQHVLTAQDRQGFKPHVTIQNKVAPETARRLLENLRTSFTPFHVTIEGLILWRYLGGPWEHIRDHPFSLPRE